MADEKEILEAIEKIQNVHYPSGPIYQEITKVQAEIFFNKNELAGIYYLKESHAPGLRTKTVIRNIKNAGGSGDCANLNRTDVDFTCNKMAGHDSIQEMLRQIWEMPAEWTLVQITSRCNSSEFLELLTNKHFTNDLYVTVFQCGKDKHDPFCIHVPAPVDISGAVMNLKGEMISILHDNKEILKPKTSRPNPGIRQKEYCTGRFNLNNRLKNLVKDVQNYWLGEWRCLLVGKLTGDGEQKVEKMLEAVLNGVDAYKLTKKIKNILKCLIRANSFLKTAEIKKVIQYCFPEDQVTTSNILKAMVSFFKDNPVFSELRVHPVILIIDEKLDVIPWEMVDTMINNPVSRMPSLHFTYALFKQYQNRIKKGVMVGFNARSGKYVINPDLDLMNMAKRITTFTKKRLPLWSGLINEKPKADDIEKCILESDIFGYFGHGNGSQFISNEKIQKLSISSIICLFGCSSSSYIHLGSQVEAYGAHQMYLLACSPCLVGALWTVTDNDTDVFSTEFFDIWLPPVKNFNWKNIDRTEWERTGEVTIKKDRVGKESSSYEPDLLRALCKARKAPSQYLTQASFVARGLPVSLVEK